MYSDHKESIRTFYAMANNKRIERRGCPWTKLECAVGAIDGTSTEICLANRTTRAIFFWTSTFPCNTYASNY